MRLEVHGRVEWRDWARAPGDAYVLRDAEALLDRWREACDPHPSVERQLTEVALRAVSLLRGFGDRGEPEWCCLPPRVVLWNTWRWKGMR